MRMLLAVAALSCAVSVHALRDSDFLQQPPRPVSGMFNKTRLSTIKGNGLSGSAMSPMDLKMSSFAKKLRKDWEMQMLNRKRRGASGFYKRPRNATRTSSKTEREIIRSAEAEANKEEEEVFEDKTGKYENVDMSVMVGDRKYDVFSLKAKHGGSNGTVVFLHGNAFTHSIWRAIGTMDAVAAAGWMPIAVDLPGKGFTLSPVVNKSNPIEPLKNRGPFLTEYLKAMSLTGENRPVIVSPSMSGTYAIPCILANPEAFRAWVPIAPSGATNITDAQWASVNIPTYTMFGSRDSLGYVTSATMFRAIPRARSWRVEDGSHAFYLRKSEIFNKKLVAFLKELASKKATSGVAPAPSPQAPEGAPSADARPSSPTKSNTTTTTTN